jgi:hypothetical protein
MTDHDPDDLRPAVVALLRAAGDGNVEMFAYLVRSYNAEGASEKIWALLDDLDWTLAEIVTAGQAETQRRVLRTWRDELRHRAEVRNAAGEGGMIVYDRCLITVDRLERIGTAAGETLDEVLARLGLIAADDDKGDDEYTS